MQSQHLGTRHRAGIQSWPRLHEILSLKRVLLLTCSKWGKYVCPFPPKYVNELKKDLNPIPLHHLQHSCKRTDDRYITKVSTASCMLSRGTQPRSNSDVRLCRVQREQWQKNNPGHPQPGRMGLGCLSTEDLRSEMMQGKKRSQRRAEEHVLSAGSEPQIQKSRYMYLQTYIYTHSHTKYKHKRLRLNKKK